MSGKNAQEVSGKNERETKQDENFEPTGSVHQRTNPKGEVERKQNND